MLGSGGDTAKPVVTRTVKSYRQRAVAIAERELTNPTSQHFQLVKQWMDVLDLFVECGFGEEEYLRRVRRELDVEYCHSQGIASIYDF